MKKLTYEEKIAIAVEAMRQVLKAYTRNGKCHLSKSMIGQHAFIKTGNVFPRRGYLKPDIDKVLSLLQNDIDKLTFLVPSENNK